MTRKTDISEFTARRTTAIDSLADPSWLVMAGEFYVAAA